jgi:hypothetical protein
MRRVFQFVSAGFLSAAAFALHAQQSNTAVAAASEDRTPRVGIVLSEFAGSEDHDGAKLPGLPDPKAKTAELSDDQVRAMVWKAIELGNTRRGGLDRIVGRAASVVVLADAEADPRIIHALVQFLRERRAGQTITVATKAASTLKGLAGVEVLDLNTAETMSMPVPGVFGRRDVSYHVPKALLKCDMVITVSPLRLQKQRPSFSIDAYRQFLPAAKYSGPAALQKMGSPDQIAIDLFSYHPSEYSIVGGTAVLKDGKRVRHNLVLAGTSAVAVDTVASTILGLNAEEVPLLKLADERGFREPVVEIIWLRGNEIDDVKPQ